MDYYECIKEYSLPVFNEFDESDDSEYMTIEVGSEWELSECAPNSADIMLQEIDGSRWLGIYDDILNEYFVKADYSNTNT